jgi:hypothetical protein
MKLFGITIYMHNKVLKVHDKYCKDLLEIRFKGWKEAEKAYGKAQCPCCGYMSLPENGAYEICHVCFWEDGGDEPNHMTLKEAQKNFHRYGSIYKTFDPSVVIPYEKRRLP